MVTLLKMPRRWEDGSYNFGFGGKSTDTKPTKTWDDYTIGNGSSFFEIDTLSLYFYDLDTESWIKAEIKAGSHSITADNLTATATVDSTTGTPSVRVTKSVTGNNINFAFDFKGLKGANGGQGSGTDTSGDVTYTATVDGTTGTPAVKVTTSETDSGTVINFAFTGLKGENGTGGTSDSSTKMEVGKDNTLNGGFAVGYNNTTAGAGSAVGHSNTADTDSLAVGQKVTANSNQLAVGTNFKGLTQFQTNSGLKTPAFSLIAATNDSESTRFDFAVPNSGPGGIIVRGKTGSADAYYWVKIADGNITATDITSRLTMS